MAGTAREAEELVRALADDPARAPLPDNERAMIDFALKLNLTPSRITNADTDQLRRLGWSDVAIHDMAQVTALFAYYNRLADGLGVDPEPDW